MKLDYYNLPFGAQLLLWTSRVIVNGSCRTFPNKYELVDLAYKKVGLDKGLFLLKDLLSLIKNKENFRLQSICKRELIENEINLIYCVEDNKNNNYDNNYYVKLWNLENKIKEFSTAANKLSRDYKKFNLNTNLYPLKADQSFPKTIFLTNNTIH